MNKEFYTPNDFCGTDSERIQMAIAEAKKSGADTVVIPKHNKGTNSFKWVIDKTILLPSDITIILDNCYMVMADDTYCQMFRTENLTAEEGKTKQGEQKNINIIGRGNAQICGGKENKLNEFTSEKEGNPHITANVLIYLYNVRDFRIEGFKISDQRWWAILLLYARYGTVKNLDFKINTRHSYGVWRNQDGIDLRVGCNNISIENITGEAGDDLIALTALASENSFEYSLKVENRDTDIHDCTIKNVKGFSNMCAIVRLLNQHGNKIYNISISDIFDAGIPRLESKVQMVLRIGEDAYYTKLEERAKLGEMYNISINNIYSKALTAIHLEMAVKNLHASNIFVYEKGHHAVTLGRFYMTNVFMYIPERYDEYEKERLIPDENKIYFPDIDTENIPEEMLEKKTTLENILIENIYYTAKPDYYTPAVCAVANAELNNVQIKNVFCDSNVLKEEYFNMKKDNIVR